MDTESLAHTRWNCKYHIVFAPKYRRQIIYGKIKKDIGKIIRTLCDYKKVEIIEANACADHIHMLVSIPPKLSVSAFMGYLKGKSSLMIFDRHANLKYKYGNRHFWCRGYYVDTVGRNKKAIEQYIRKQLQEDIAADQLSIKEFIDPFTGETVEKKKNSPPTPLGVARDRVRLAELSVSLKAQPVPCPYRARANHPLSGWS
ncbi:transposase IS200-family protein [Desulfitobacterium hafniense DCB-2]|uniref:Transposase IS200-family protein n=1 Tax=Desulfitobacterium hafniense (strain DSM 10664 / DCB-2) TaxID=272564 RepID=B8FS60_DESHD|nr:transposase IS200-family protein [Desulfitobacterium hafniense DCB-2]